MQTLIITDKTRQAEFIQKGFQYENLAADVRHFDEFATIQEQIPFYDGVFLLLDDCQKAREYVFFCRALKAQIPIIILAQSDSPDLRALVNELEIHFYAARPFSFRRISSEMRILIFQSHEGRENQQYILRDLELDVSRHRVQLGGEDIHLRNKEFALLHFLMLNQGKVLSRTEILENVWDRNANILTNTVDVHVSQLRKKIEDFTDDPYIHTVPCRGYIFA